MVEEQLHRYPRHITWPIEVLCAVLVGWRLIDVARTALLLLWRDHPLDSFVLERIPRLAELVAWLERTGPRQPTLSDLLTPLGWLGAALLVALVARNAFPPVRASLRGLLVWFGNDWVPVRWEGIRALRITDSPNGKRFVVLVQTDRRQLTPYHRLYSLLYRLGWRRGFLIGSAISDSERLVRGLLEEIERRRKLGEQLPVTIDDRSRSLLFGLLVDPLGLFGRRTATQPVFQPVTTVATISNAAAFTLPSMGGTPAPAPAPTSAPAASRAEPAPPAGEVIVAGYPRALRLGLNLLTALIVLFAAWRYLVAWGTFLIFTFPSLQEAPVFRAVEVQPLVSHWGLLIGAHLGLLLLAAVLTMVHTLFPDVVVDRQGLTFRVLGRDYRLTWEQISFVKATDVRDDRHVILVEAANGCLPWPFIIGSWLYDGGLGRGALIWPMISSFEPVMQRVALELTRRQQPDQPPRLRDDAPGWLLMLVARPAEALDRLVQGYEAEVDAPRDLDLRQILQAGLRMLWVAAGPAAVLLISWMMYKGIVLSLQVPLVLLLLLLWGLAEWPLAALLASSLDQMIGTGTKGHQGLYLYPLAQLTRLLPFGVAIVLLLMGFPSLSLLAWLAGIAWSGLLTAGLWEALYGWHGLPLLGASLITVFYQILTLIGVLVLRG